MREGEEVEGAVVGADGEVDLDAALLCWASWLCLRRICGFGHLVDAGPGDGEAERVAGGDGVHGAEGLGDVAGFRGRREGPEGEDVEVAVGGLVGRLERRAEVRVEAGEEGVAACADVEVDGGRHARGEEEVGEDVAAHCGGGWRRCGG